MSRVVLATVPHAFSLERDSVHTEMFPNVGLAYVATAAAAAGHEAIQLDPGVEGVSIEDFARRVAALRPRVLAMSCYTIDVDNAADVARELKRLAPETTVVVGGYHPSAVPEDTLRRYRAFDAVVIGEGERTFVELVAALERGTPLVDVPGLALADGIEVIRTAERAQIPDLDALPYPSYEGLPLRRYRRMYSWNRGGMLPICASRGCPYLCNFCYRSHGTRVRYRSAASVVGEMRRDVERHGVGQIIFTDETFTLNRRHTLQLCEAIEEAGLHRRVSWMAETRVDAVDRELLARMHRAGCSLLSFGVETGNQDTLDESAKRSTLEAAREAFGACAEVGILTGANFILGHPHDTVRRIERTIAFARTLRPTYAQFAIMTPFPGTEIAAMARRGEGGLVVLNEDWRTYGKQIGAPLELAGIPRRDLERLQRRAYVRFYLRPSRIRRLFEIVDPWTLAKYALRTARVGLEPRLGRLWPRLGRRPPALAGSHPESQGWNGGLAHRG